MDLIPHNFNVPHLPDSTYASVEKVQLDVKLRYHEGIYGPTTTTLIEAVPVESVCNVYFLRVKTAVDESPCLNLN